jgi:2-keto-3-deoxy-L-rhamnonate aldolase RhmA
MGCSLGFHERHDYDLPAMLASKEMEPVYTTVVEACTKAGVLPGVFCLGEARANQLAGKGFVNIAYGTDTGVLMDHVAGVQERLGGSSDAAAE